MDTNSIYDRTKLVIGEESLEKIKKTKVVICGIGGVGSYAMEALARIGIGNITIIDKDKVNITNINRQIIADTKTIGLVKVLVAKERINNINPQIEVKAIEDYIDNSNLEKYLSNADYIIDAIDSVESKLMLISYAKENNIQIISSMGMANKLNPMDIKVGDIEKTEMCSLAKIIRKKLKEINISKVKVVYSTESPIKNKKGVLGSVSFVPSVAGLIIASEVVKDIIKK